MHVVGEWAYSKIIFWSSHRFERLISQWLNIQMAKSPVFAASLPRCLLALSQTLCPLQLAQAWNAQSKMSLKYKWWTSFACITALVWFFWHQIISVSWLHITLWLGTRAAWLHILLWMGTQAALLHTTLWLGTQAAVELWIQKLEKEQWTAPKAVA